MASTVLESPKGLGGWRLTTDDMGKARRVHNTYQHYNNAKFLSLQFVESGEHGTSFCIS